MRELIGDHWREMLRYGLKGASEDEVAAMREFFYAGAMVVVHESTRHESAHECALAMQDMIEEVLQYKTDNPEAARVPEADQGQGGHHAHA